MFTESLEFSVPQHLNDHRILNAHLISGKKTQVIISFWGSFFFNFSERPVLAINRKMVILAKFSFFDCIEAVSSVF